MVETDRIAADEQFHQTKRPIYAREHVSAYVCFILIIKHLTDAGKLLSVRLSVLSIVSSSHVAHVRSWGAGSTYRSISAAGVRA